MEDSFLIGQKYIKFVKVMCERQQGNPHPPTEFVISSFCRQQPQRSVWVRFVFQYFTCSSRAFTNPLPFISIIILKLRTRLTQNHSACSDWPVRREQDTRWNDEEFDVTRFEASGNRINLATHDVVVLSLFYTLDDVVFLWFIFVYLLF